MQLSMNFAPPKPDTRSILLDIVRRKGPCRSIGVLCQNGLPDDTYDVFYELVRDGSLVVVGEVRFKGVVPAEHVDKLYAVKEAA